MGHRRNNQDQLFYSFLLEDQILNNNFIRKDDEAFGVANPIVPKFMSPEDPAANAYSISFVCIFSVKPYEPLEVIGKIVRGANLNQLEIR